MLRVPLTRCLTQCFSTAATRSALVTGGSQGLGNAISRRLANDGYSVFIADIDDKAGTELADNIGAIYLPCNVCDPEDVEKAVQSVVQKAGSLDALVTSAGIVGSQVPTGDYASCLCNEITPRRLHKMFSSVCFSLTHPLHSRTHVLHSLTHDFFY